MIITIAAAFGVSTGIENSKVAKLIADSLVSVGKESKILNLCCSCDVLGKAIGGDFFVMCAMYLATMILSNLVANNAAAALMFPIAMDVAKRKNFNFSKIQLIHVIL